MTNLAAETPRAQLVRTIQEELAGRFIHDGWTVKDVAEKAELSWSTVSNNFRRRVHRPQFTTILALAKVLDVELTFKGEHVFLDKGEMSISRRPRKLFRIGDKTFSLPMTEKEIRARQGSQAKGKRLARARGKKKIVRKPVFQVVGGKDHIAA